MRQFCHKYVKDNIWVFEGHRSNFLGPDAYITSSIFSLEKILKVEDIIELKPDEFIYLDFLKRNGYTMPHDGVFLVHSVPAVVEMLAKLAREGSRAKEESPVLNKLNPTRFVMNRKCWCTSYVGDACGSSISTVISVQEATEYLVSLIIPENPVLKIEKLEFKLDKSLNGNSLHIILRNDRGDSSTATISLENLERVNEWVSLNK